MALSAQQQQELSEHHDQNHITQRATAPGLESYLYRPIPLLDHGFIRVIDYMGDDDAIVQAARVSYGRGTKRTNEDQGLINYLMRHRHSTPFEMCEIKYHVKLPIFVARQWIRHRTANVNEYSGRYSVMGKDFYIPNAENLAAQSQSNRQGRAEILNPDQAHHVLNLLRRDAEQVYAHYEEMLNTNEDGKILDANRSGLARELARMNLTLNYYTEWYWKTDLHNLLHFLSLRADSHAQYEIRVYADAMLETVKQWVPKTFAAYQRYRAGAVSVSGPEIEILKKMLQGQKISMQDTQLSRREWQEFCRTFDLELN